jgi:hypothetical protein
MTVHLYIASLIVFDVRRLQNVYQTFEKYEKRELLVHGACRFFYTLPFFL